MKYKDEVRILYRFILVMSEKRGKLRYCKRTLKHKILPNYRGNFTTCSTSIRAILDHPSSESTLNMTGRATGTFRTRLRCAFQPKAWVHIVIKSQQIQQQHLLQNPGTVDSVASHAGFLQIDKLESCGFRRELFPLLFCFIESQSSISEDIRLKAWLFVVLGTSSAISNYNYAECTFPSQINCGKTPYREDLKTSWITSGTRHIKY